MSNIAEVKRIEAGNWQVIDLRTNKVVKRKLQNGGKAAAYVTYYTQEVEKAEKQWAEWDK